MTKEELAKDLDGIEYREPFHVPAELTVIHGASDDLLEMDGGVKDEAGAWRGGTFLIDRNGVLPEWEDVRDDISESDAETYFKRKSACAEVKVFWAQNGYSWSYETYVPHATFDIVEGDDKYCRAIVVDTDSLPNGLAKAASTST